MRKYLLTIWILLLALACFGQGGVVYNQYYISGSLSVGRGKTFPDVSEWLVIGPDSANKGLGLPKVLIDSFLTTRRGVMVYNLRDSNMYIVDGSQKIRYLNIKDTTLIKQFIQNSGIAGTVTSVNAAINSSGTTPSVTGGPITNAGTLTFNLPNATATGVTAGLISKAAYDSLVNAYGARILSAAFTGGRTKVLTLTKSDGSTVIASTTIDTAGYSDTSKYSANAGQLGGNPPTYYQPALGFTPENVANKVTTLVGANNTTYPTSLTVANAIAAIPVIDSNRFLKQDDTATFVATRNWVATNYYNKTQADARFLKYTDSTTVYYTVYDVDTAKQTIRNTYVPITRAINTNSPLSGGGNLSADRTLSIANSAADGVTKGAASFTANDFDASAGNISIDYANGQAASSTNKGFLTAADWNTFNNKGPGTVTSVGVTDGTEIDFSVTNPTTTPNITGVLINGSIANNKLTNSTISGISLGSNLANHSAGTGLTGSTYNGSAAQSWSVTTPLTDADKGDITVSSNGTVFSVDNGAITNAKLANSTISGVSLGNNLNALTIQSPLTGTSYNGSAPVTIGIPAASSSVNGYLLSTDWTIFNNKVSTTRSISTTSPLSGGGDLSADRTFSVGGLSSIGTANYIVGVNAGGTAWEYKQLIAGTNVTITPGVGSVTISATGGGGSGDVVGPSSATDNAIVRYDLTTGKLIQNSGIILTDDNAFLFPPITPPTAARGQLYYDNTTESLTFVDSFSNTSQQLGQEVCIPVYNNTGSNIPDGTVLYSTGQFNGFQMVAPAQANAASTSVVVGVATKTIANASYGKMTTMGYINNINTTGLTAGQAVYLSPTTPGAITNTAPSAPNYRFRVGFVTTVGASGRIYHSPSTGALGNGTANQVFGMNATGTAQEVKSIVGGTGITVNNTANQIEIVATGGGGGTPGGSNTQVQYNNSGAFGGATNFNIYNGNPQIDSISATSATPTAPTEGVALFSRGGSGLFSFVDRNGHEFTVQPNEAYTRTQRLYGAFTFTSLQILGTNGIAVGSSVSKTWAATNRQTQSSGTNYSTTAATNIACGAHTGTNQCFRSTQTDGGGFIYYSSFGLPAFNAAGRFIAGLLNGGVSPGGSPDYSSNLNYIAIIKDAADATFQFSTRNGTLAATKVSTGITPSNANWYDVVIYCPRNQNIGYMKMVEHTTSGINQVQWIFTSNLPDVGTGLGPELILSTGTTATISTISIGQIVLLTNL